MTARNQYMLIYNSLRNAGYRVISNDCFILPSDPLAVAQIKQRLRRTGIGYNTCNVKDIIGVGPATTSQTSTLYTQNQPVLERYQQSLSQQQLPITSGLKLDHNGHLLRLILDQLLCYHTLDIGYFESRYDMDFQALFGHTMAALEESLQPPLLATHNQQLSLTPPPDGIIHLRAICRSLLLNDNPALIE